MSLPKDGAAYFAWLTGLVFLTACTGGVSGFADDGGAFLGEGPEGPGRARIGAVPLGDRPGPARSLPVDDDGGRGSRQFAVLTKAAAGSPTLQERPELPEFPHHT